MADRSVAWKLILDAQGVVEGARVANNAFDSIEKNGVTKTREGLSSLEQSIKAHPQAWNDLGAAALLFGGAAVAGFAMAGKAAMSWESDWAGVTKTVNGTTTQLSGLEGGLRDLAANTLPATHTEIAGVAEAAGQLGIKTGNVLLFTKTMIDMGESTNLSADQAATSIARFSNIMGTSQSDVGRLGAAVVGLGNNFATTEAEIMDMAMRIAGAGQQANMSEGDVLGFSAALSSVGIEAEAGGTAISMVMKKMGDEVSANGDKLSTFAEVSGMTVEEFSAAWRDDAAGAMATFIGGLGEAQASGENVNATLETLGITGIREADALLRLSSASDVLTDALATGNEEYARGIALIEEANKRYETAESRVAIAGNAIKDAAISFGDVFLPAVAGAADGVADFAGWIGDLPAPVKELGAGLGVTAGGALLVAGGFLTLAPRVFDVIDGFKALNKEHPGVAAGLGAVGRAAGIATAVIVATQVAAAIFGEDASTAAASVEKLTAAMVEMQNETKTDVKGTILDPELWDKANSGWARTMSGWTHDIDGWGDALARSEEGMYNFRRALDFTDSGQLDIIAQQIENTDTALANLSTSGALQTAQESFQAIAAEGRGAGLSLEETFEKFPDYEKSLTNVASAAGMATDQETLLKIATGEITPAMLEAQASAGGTSEKLSEMGVEAQSTGDKVAELAEELRGFGSATLSEREALRGFEEALYTAEEALKQNGKTLKTSTEEGRANEAALDGVATSANEAAAAMVENGATAEELRTHLETSRKELIRVARSFGMSEDQAKAYADQVLLTPEEVTTRVKALGIDKALDGITDVQEALANVKDKTVWVNVNERYVRENPGRGREYKTSRHGSVFEHDGGIVQFMAAGGFSSMSGLAEMVHPNTWRVVGDRGDVDEAFIPLDGSPRSIEILLEAIRRMPALDPQVIAQALGLTGMALGGLTADPLALTPPLESTGRTDEDMTAMAETTQEALASMAEATRATYEQMDADTLASLELRGVETTTWMTTLQTTLATGFAAMAATQLASLTTMQTTQATAFESMAADQAGKIGRMETTQRDGWARMNEQTKSSVDAMRLGVSDTMGGMASDLSTRMGQFESTTDTGFGRIEEGGKKDFAGLREGIDAEMGKTPGDVGGSLNRTIGVLNSFAAEVNKAFGDVGVKLPSAKSLKFAEGGVMPGYTPGRDVHEFYSPTGGRLALSGGEAFMVPEFTKSVGGEKGIRKLNQDARAGRLDPEHLIQHFADGGVWRNLWAMTKEQFPNAVLTSAYRPGSITASGNLSHHARGNAIDVSPSMAIFDWWHDNYGKDLAELIYSPANGRQIKNGAHYYYQGAVRAQHFDHVHIAAVRALSEAMASGLPGAGGGMSHPFLEKAGITPGGDLAKSYAEAAEKLTQELYGKYAKQLPSGIAGQLGKGLMSQVSEGLIDKAKEYGKNSGMANFSNVAAGPVKTMARQMLEQMGWADQWGDLDWLLTRESGWNPNAQNPTSSAYGLFQFLNSTWDDVGGTKTSDPRKQLEYGLKYIRQRYGDIRGARRFWESHNWYVGGTSSALPGPAVVGEDGWEYVKFSDGQWARAGLGGPRGYNFTGGEQVIPHQQSVAIENQIVRTSQPRTVELAPEALKAITESGQVSAAALATALDGVPLRLVLDDGRELNAHISTQVGRIVTSANRSH